MDQFHGVCRGAEEFDGSHRLTAALFCLSTHEMKHRAWHGRQVIMVYVSFELGGTRQRLLDVSCIVEQYKCNYQIRRPRRAVYLMPNYLYHMASSPCSRTRVVKG